MKPLLKIMLTLALVFASTFVLLRSTGLLSLEKIELYLQAAKAISPFYIALLISALLIADLLIAVPTLTLLIFSGYWLGPVLGSLTGMLGVTVAGHLGYLLSRRYGEALLCRLVPQAEERAAAMMLFRQHGSGVLLLARALPILPEVSACMAGVCAMPWRRFALYWLLGSLPYVLIASLAGAYSSVENPQPALYTALGLTGGLWLAWLVFRRRIQASGAVG
ncbi:TVP38/TMEM64 family protein [Balneatrix alpica]|uniref:TVP38/TMEM64 family protein n=1 Tax=Balneatrix alpica TaxID=75684 RepID=UPI0027388F02|nr:VTT domain-containing protein [Balneatrix alpica]